MVPTTTERYVRPAARGWRTSPPPPVREFHAALPGYAPTRLVEIPDLAAELGVGRVFVKEESERFGLPAFKILGAAYAVVRALAERAGIDGAPPPALLRDRIDPVTLIAATDGNHGRAVARTARWLGRPARIYLPRSISAAAKAAIRTEGAEVVELDQPYDDVVRTAAADAGEDRLLIQDTTWTGYTAVPQWIVDGYDTLFAEADDQLRSAAATASLVVVPVGVGSLAQAAVRHHRSGTAAGPRLLAVEPVGSAPVLRSLLAGTPVSVPTDPTTMAGLSCGTPSALAWPLLRDGLDAAVAVTDDEAVHAADDLAAYGVDAGPCGAATLAGLRRAALDLPADASVLLISTEGRAANPIGGQR